MAGEALRMGRAGMGKLPILLGTLHWLLRGMIYLSYFLIEISIALV
jgi:hypothetical protein